jgi:hypothetical protein
VRGRSRAHNVVSMPVTSWHASTQWTKVARPSAPINVL